MAIFGSPSPHSTKASILKVFLVNYSWVIEHISSNNKLACFLFEFQDEPKIQLVIQRQQHMSIIFLYYDSEATMTRAYNNIYIGKSRHISIWYGYIRELITNGVITIVYVTCVNNLADPLIKGLSSIYRYGTENN